MGQYYKIYMKRGLPDPMLGDGVSETVVIKPTLLGEGLKLIENSYVGNPVTNTVLAALMHGTAKHPFRMAYVGDYVPDWDAPKDLDKRFVFDAYANTWADNGLTHVENDRRSMRSMARYVEDSEHMTGGVYIVDMDRKTYVKTSFDAPDSLSEFSPIGILTAMGNGLGSGDYHGTCMEHVGTWAGDRLYATAEWPVVEDDGLRPFLGRFDWARPSGRARRPGHRPGLPSPCPGNLFGNRIVTIANT